MECYVEGMDEGGKILELHHKSDDTCVGDETGVKSASMYAITFDMDTDKLKAQYHNNSWNNAYGDIRKILEEHGFSWQQESVYFGDPKKVNAVTAVLAIVDVTRRCDPWFARSVKDVRMLRIEDNNDLMPAVKDVALAAFVKPPLLKATVAIPVKKKP